MSEDIGDKDQLKRDLDKALAAGSTPQIIRFILACLGGVHPAAGVLGAAGATWGEKDQNKFNKVLGAWLKMHEQEIEEIGRTMTEIIQRIDMNDERTEQRLRSPEYLSIVRKCFRNWSAAESEVKRSCIRNLLVAAGSISICTDDVVRLFVEWIEKYSEPHFKVIKTVYENSDGITRAEIWQEIHGEQVREDSAEADLFKTLIHDLSVGHVIRQHRAKDAMGRYLKVNPQRQRGMRRPVNPYVKTAFDDEKDYELTELGSQFVRYTMNEVVPRLQGPMGNDVLNENQ